MTQIPSLADLMLTEMRRSIELAYLPGGPESFQRRLIEADQPGAPDLMILARLISLIQAALNVSDAGAGGDFDAWYRDMAKRLLRRSMNVIAGMDAGAQQSKTVN